VLTRSYRALVLAVSAVAIFANGCTQHAQAPARAEPLAVVSPLPSPSPGPPVLSVAPLGTVDTQAQIRIVFSDDLIPLERLESPDETAILARFSIVPALPGQFHFLTPRMIGFEADRAWPVATRVRVTIAKGLRDLHGHSLGDDLSWTFQTGAIALDELPGKPWDTQLRDLRPKITFTSNVALDRASLETHARLRAMGPAPGEIALVVPPDTATPSPGVTAAPDVEYDPSANVWNYVLVPAAELARGTQYDVDISPGLMPRDGNLPSDRSFAGSFHTYDALRFQNVDLSHKERFASGDPMLAFTTPIDPKSLGALALSPAPPAGSTAFAAVDNEVSVNAALLAPDTTYTVAIGTGLRDTFGQQLAAAQRATFRTGDLSADVWAPSGTNLFPASRDVRLNVVAVNAPATRATFRPLRPVDVVQFPDPSGSDGDVLGASAGWPSFDVRAAHNVERTIAVPLRTYLGAPAGALAYGVATKLPRQTDPFIASGVVLLTDLGAFAQFFPDGGSVRVDRIADGTPVGGAQVEIYASQADAQTKTTPVACATATTGANGVATFGGAGFARCAQNDKGENDAPTFVTIVRQGADWTYVRTDAYSGAFVGDFYNGWSSATPASYGTIFSDGELYQPGETAQLVAAGWFLVDGVLRRGVAPSYEITLQLPNGDKRDLGRRALDAFGTFSLPIALDAAAPLGYYTVRATAGNGEEIDGSFRVAEFKPPNFKVDLALDHLVAQRGGTVAAAATSAYLFGAPLAGASTKYTVTRSPVDFTPQGRDAFSFGRKWFWPEQQPDASTDVLETTLTDDATGKSSVSVPIAGDLPYPMAYAVDAETTDASNIAVADSKLFTALPSNRLIGLRSDDVGTAGTPLTTNVIVTDPSGKALPGTGVHVELQSETYATATQIVEGAEQPVQSVSYATVSSADASSTAAAVGVSLTPPKPGTYRVRATLAGANDAAAESDLEVYVGGSGDTLWYGHDPNTLTVKLDKATYKPGDTATALVQSPFPNAELHVAVVRHGVLWETTQTTTSAAPTVRFQVTPQMLPNAAVEAFVVRRGPPPPKPPADGGNALARAGLTAFEVALDTKYLSATVSSKAAVLAPGAQQTVTVRVRDGAHRPVAGEVTLIVANDAVLQLTGYRPPDLVKTVYADQPISTRFSDNRAALVLNALTRPAEKGWGFGGGLSGDEADPRVRHTFSPLAYFAGALRTDANGVATATFTLPDDLTTWRAMVVATSADGRFGNAESTFRTTKPLVANPVIPQFARPGDRFDAGVAVTNGTGGTGTLRIDATLAGPLAFLVNDKPVAVTSLETPLDSITKAYRFSMIAQGTGTATATVRVRGAGTGDAFSIPVPVRDTDVTESVAQTGTTTTRASIPLDVAAETPRDAGGLDLDLASSLLPELTVAAQSALLGDDRLTLSAASRLDVAGDLVLLGKRSGSDVSAARARGAAEIATLRSLSRADGGFAAYWSAQGSDPWDSLFALEALARARAAGIPVADALLSGAHAYAAATLADPTARQKWCTSAQCKAELRLQALVALSAAGDPRTTFLDDIDAQRDKLAFADEARLARLLTQAPGYGDRAATLAKTIADHLYTTARGAVVTLPGRYRWFDDPVVAQAEALRLELVRKADGDTLDRLTRSLLGMQRNGSFGCACENAAALDALVDLAAREQPANFTATASVGGKTVATEHFTSARAPERHATVAMNALPAGRSSVELDKTGSGTLHYAVTYTYRLPSASPGSLSGLRITRVVREANAKDVLATMGLATPAAALTLTAAHVYDVELQIVTDHDVDRVLIADPIPAGLEAVDTSFATTSQALQVPSTSWAIGDQQIRVDRIEAYADHLSAGIYRLHYLARSVTPGTFAWPGANVHLADRPDEFGRSAGSLVTIH
jgi:uncharacterized protein YfaS (alpha-2-macroglobulin family)